MVKNVSSSVFILLYNHCQNCNDFPGSTTTTPLQIGIILPQSYFEYRTYLRIIQRELRTLTQDKSPSNLIAMVYKEVKYELKMLTLNPSPDGKWTGVTMLLKLLLYFLV